MSSLDTSCRTARGPLPAAPALTRARPLVIGLVLAVALLPMLLYPLGISGDYPNHLARVWIEHRLAASDALRENFVVDWGIYPDLAMDLFMRPLMTLTDPYTAGALFNVLAVAMLPLGVALLSRVTTGRVGLSVAASALLLYGKPLAWGFINFVFTAGLALCLFALWVRMRPGWPRTALFVLLMPVLFFSHVLGFLLFGYLMLAYEIGRFAAGERGRLTAFLRGLVLRDGLTAVLPLALFVASLRDRLSGLETEISGFGGLASRGQALVAPFDFDNGIAAVLVLAGCYLTLLVAFRRGWLTLTPALRPVFWASVALVLVVPAAFSGISFLHIRFGAIPAAILLAGATLTPAGRARALPLGAVLIGLLAVQQVVVHERMSFLDRAQSEVRAAVSVLPEGARVLVGADEVTPFVYRMNHAPAFAVIEADGYVANLFTNTSPVGVTERAQPLHRPQAWPLSAEELAEGARRAPSTSEAPNGIHDDYFHGWPRTFDALVWFTTPGGTLPDETHLREIERHETFRLYAVARGTE
ncbi:hypothetical protein [Roseivivax marinus]|uniref:hypothetical protein n=1 Tax=Roseivivax marinus TaxID=1379903 RepID=UPI0027402ECA|nr:hypothetical protein [Roseivivax marinus]